MGARLPRKALSDSLNLAEMKNSVLAKLDSTGLKRKALALVRRLVPASSQPDRVRATTREREHVFVARLLKYERGVHRRLHSAVAGVEIDGDIACTGVDCEGPAITVAHAGFLQALELLQRQQVDSAMVVPLSPPQLSRAEAIVALRAYGLTFREIVSLMPSKQPTVPLKLVRAQEASLREALSAAERAIRVKSRPSKPASGTRRRAAKS